MSGENLNREEIKDRREEIFTELGSNLTTAHSELCQLNDSLGEYRETLNDIEVRYSNLPQDQQLGFASSLETIAEDAAEADSPREVLDTKEELEAAFENPLIRSVQNHYFTLYDELGIPISEEIRRELEGKIRATTETDPEETLENAQELLRKLDDLADPVDSAFTSFVEDNLRNITDPGKLISVLEEFKSRYQSLKTLSRTLSEYAWAPPQLDELHTWVELVTLGADIDCTDQADNIEGLAQSIPDIVPVETVIANELEERITDLQSGPTSVFDKIESNLKKISGYEEELAEVETLSEVLDFETGSEEFMETVVEWKRAPPDRLSVLVESVEVVVRGVHIWRAELSSEWQKKRRIVSAYADIIESEPPDSVAEYVDKELSSEVDLAHAYSVLVKANSWIAEQENKILEHLSPDAKELFLAISENQQYDISKEELDALAELMDIVDIKVVMDERQN
ncbi:hypothetical protein [Halomicrococcus sp. SG-WS-1]|uniref:hypothetical protein n=1 Tax=Halomicrococcus sp. SG-WS-1 TaxID=3439057 RepID=UPI003F78DCE7